MIDFCFKSFSSTRREREGKKVREYKMYVTVQNRFSVEESGIYLASVIFIKLL